MFILVITNNNNKKKYYLLSTKIMILYSALKISLNRIVNPIRTRGRYVTSKPSNKSGSNIIFGTGICHHRLPYHSGENRKGEALFVFWSLNLPHV